MNYELKSLPNEVRVVTGTLGERRSVALGLWVGAGGRHETPAENGVAHFIEHLLFKGTTQRTANQIKESVEGIGGSLNAFTSEECTVFMAKVPARHLESVFQVLSDMLLNPLLNAADIEKERTVILEEIKMIQDQPSQLVDELLVETLWPNHSLGRPLTGTEETVGGFKREDFVRFRDVFYQAPYLTVSAAGDIAHEKLMTLASHSFGGLAAKPKTTPALFTAAQNKPAHKFLVKKTEQTHLALAFHAFPKDHPDEYAMDLLHIILGGNMSSRLFNEVREERGLAYDIGSSMRKYHDTGAFFIGAGVAHRKAPEALRVIFSVLEAVRSGAVPEDELSRAKEFLVGQFELSLENPTNLMLWIGESVTTEGLVKDPDALIARIRAVSVEDLRRVAQTVLKNERLALAAIGPSVEKDKLNSILL